MLQINDKILSLCIPTNGMDEWVVPLLKSVYIQECDPLQYEIVIADNGNNEKFYNKIKYFIDKYENIVYKKTNAVLFQNQIECFRLASGKFVKFLNHRDVLNAGSINKIINIIKENECNKPIIYFLNSQKMVAKSNIEIDFDTFMYEISYFSTWSGGLSFWRNDADMLLTKEKYDVYFPHIDILFAFENNRKYLIVNEKLSYQEPVDASKKGKYDLFEAFSNHYIEIIKKLELKRAISSRTFQHIRNENRQFVLGLHYYFVVKKLPCSYLTANFWKCFLKQYTYFDFAVGYFKLFISKIKNRMTKYYEK